MFYPWYIYFRLPLILLPYIDFYLSDFVSSSTIFPAQCTLYAVSVISNCM